MSSIFLDTSFRTAVLPVPFLSQELGTESVECWFYLKQAVITCCKMKDHGPFLLCWDHKFAVKWLSSCCVLVGLVFISSGIESSLTWNILGNLNERLKVSLELVRSIWAGPCLGPVIVTFAPASKVNSDLFFKTGLEWRKLKKYNFHLVTREENS